jgi:hypothetical protein
VKLAESVGSATAMSAGAVAVGATLLGGGGGGGGVESPPPPPPPHAASIMLASVTEDQPVKVRALGLARSDVLLIPDS